MSRFGWIVTKHVTNATSLGTIFLARKSRAVPDASRLRR
jgi:hypothetical protein